MSKFTNDHPIEFVRGLKKPSKGKILKTLARRASHLASKLEPQAKIYGWENVRNSAYARELLAFVAVADMLEEEKQDKADGPCAAIEIEESRVTEEELDLMSAEYDAAKDEWDTAEWAHAHAVTLMTHVRKSMLRLWSVSKR